MEDRWSRLTDLLRKMEHLIGEYAYRAEAREICVAEFLPALLTLCDEEFGMSAADVIAGLQPERKRSDGDSSPRSS